jgi:hypothetical protein
MAFMLGITPWPVASALLWIILVVSALYLARPTAHKAIQAMARAFHRGFRTASGAVSRSQAKLAARNRDVLLAAGREAKERVIEREFDRINDTVRKDLGNYAALHRSLDESIKRIEDDHQQSVNVPPDPPGWVKAVDAIAKIDEREGRFGVGNILSDIHKSLVKAHREAMAAYVAASKQRHQFLKEMRPDWRAIQKTLSRVGKNVDSLLARSVTIDRLMQEYEDIVCGHDRAVSVLSSSSLVNFFVSALVLTVAIGGAAINFSLIARPMAEMVGGTSLIGGYRTADIAALVIIMVEISMGLFLMESLRITRLFPVIGALPDKVRIRMAVITFTILFLLASVEAGLAYMREVLLHDELATSALLRRDAAATATNGYLWITTAAQMGMGFILPFALTFVAIPLETFVHSLRTVVGMIGIALLRFTSLVLRLIGNASLHLGTLLEQLYDLPLFVPLWFEQRLGQEVGGKGRHAVSREARS